MIIVLFEIWLKRKKALCLFGQTCPIELPLHLQGMLGQEKVKAKENFALLALFAVIVAVPILSLKFH